MGRMTESRLGSQGKGGRLALGYGVRLGSLRKRKRKDTEVLIHRGHPLPLLLEDTPVGFVQLLSDGEMRGGYAGKERSVGKGYERMSQARNLRERADGEERQEGIGVGRFGSNRNTEWVKNTRTSSPILKTHTCCPAFRLESSSRKYSKRTGT